MIIGKVGAKTWRVRLAIGLIYAVLGLGAVTMVYPFLLMLSGSTASEADAASISVYPRFWTDDAMLFRKYAESKHNASMENLRAAWQGAATGIPSWRKVEKPASADPAAIAAFRAWRETPEARELGILGHTSGARLLPKNARLWRAAMEKKFNGDLAAYGRVFGVTLADWSGVMPPAEMMGKTRRKIQGDEAAQIWREFKNSRPASDLFFVIESTRRDTNDFIRLAAAVDWEDCMADAGALRREFTFRNYQDVLGFVALRGNGVRNTLIYCLLAVLTAIIVNPLAAYALSRFNLPCAWQVLLFCMATMAFPGEVTMIPVFILMKRFPLWTLAAAVAALIVVYAALGKLKRSLSEKSRVALSLLAALFAGGIASPLALGTQGGSVSLLNTFAALILPSAANGYFIFLLKGFFDSMPREIYEAADIDGAGEWTKFWTLTIGLSKPIMAVVALGAFTGAYSAFMMALIIIPDPAMWTLMVWIFQLQSQSHGGVVYASIVLAAVPTFLVFAFCQNLIIRGIVIPTEK